MIIKKEIIEEIYQFWLDQKRLEFNEVMKVMNKISPLKLDWQFHEFLKGVEKPDLKKLQSIFSVNEYEWDFAIIMKNDIIYVYSCCELHLYDEWSELVQDPDFLGVYNYESEYYLNRNDFDMFIVQNKLALSKYHESFIYS